MKTLFPLIAFACGLLWNSPAIASSPLLLGPATVNFSCKVQDLNFQQTGAKTNIVGSNTNVALVLQSTETNFTMNADSILALLANSFNTNFPAGAQLLLRSDSGNFSFVVSDGTGTNIGMFVGSVLTPSFPGEVNVGMETLSFTNGTFSGGNDTEAFTSAIRLTYNDSLMTTGDGTQTFLTLNCLVHSKQSENVATGAATENISMTVTGGGEIRNGHPVVITGTVRGTTKGFLPN